MLDVATAEARLGAEMLASRGLNGIKDTGNHSKRVERARAQLDMLRLLDSDGPKTVIELIDMLSRSNTTVRGYITSLERRGLVWAEITNCNKYRKGSRLVTINPNWRGVLCP